MKVIYTGENDPRAMKEAIIDASKEVMKDKKCVWLEADLAGCDGVKSLFGDSDRYINCGIAEANMVGICAGLASNGMKPYCHSFAPFVSRRTFDQAFLSAGYAQNPITVIGTDPGICAAFNGGTHMPFEDTGTYRMIPESTVCDATDYAMLYNFLIMAKDLDGVKYVRTPRKTFQTFYEDDAKFEIGKGIVCREGSDCLIVACGIMMHEAMQAAEKLSAQGIECAVIDPFTIKPLDVELIREYASKCGKVVVAENHNKIGGLVSAVEHAIVDLGCKFGYVAIEDEYGQVGPQDFLREEYKLTDDHITEVVKNL